MRGHDGSFIAYFHINVYEHDIITRMWNCPAKGYQDNWKGDWPISQLQWIPVWRSSDHRSIRHTNAHSIKDCYLLLHCTLSNIRLHAWFLSGFNWNLKYSLHFIITSNISLTSVTLMAKLFPILMTEHKVIYRPVSNVCKNVLNALHWNLHSWKTTPKTLHCKPKLSTTGNVLRPFNFVHFYRSKRMSTFISYTYCQKR